MATEITIRNNQTFANPELNKLVNEMAQALYLSKEHLEKTNIICAKNIARISSEKLYEEDGFDSVHDFMIKVMNMTGKSTRYNYLRAGELLNSGILPETDANGKRYTVEHLVEMGKVKSKEVLDNAIESGTLSADTTVKEMREIVPTLNPARKTPVRKEKSYAWYLNNNQTDEIFMNCPQSAIKAHEDFANCVLSDLNTIKFPGTETEFKVLMALNPDGTIDVLVRGAENTIDAEKAE